MTYKDDIQIFGAKENLLIGANENNSYIRKFDNKSFAQIGA